MIIKTITEECALVPRGAVSKQANGLNVLNTVFQGLELSIAADLNNYQLYRMPHSEWNENLLKRPSYDYATDFLDTLDAIAPPQHCNAVSLDRYDGMVFVKSLIWPGMLFFHKCETQMHGFAYFGNGRKNSELLFMIWRLHSSSSPTEWCQVLLFAKKKQYCRSLPSIRDFRQNKYFWHKLQIWINWLKHASVRIYYIDHVRQKTYAISLVTHYIQFIFAANEWSNEVVNKSNHFQSQA